MIRRALQELERSDEPTIYLFAITLLKPAESLVLGRSIEHSSAGAPYANATKPKCYF